MRNQSSQGCMIAVIAVILCIATYIMIDNFDLMRKSQDELKNTIERNTAALRRIEKGLENRPAASSSSAAYAENNRLSNFHNHSLYDPEAESGGTRVTATSNFSGNLNYVINNEGGVGNLWDLCNDSLGGRSYKNPKVFQTRMAESWQTSEDGKIFTIKLRKGIKWHNTKDPITGTEYVDVPVTSADFAFYIDTIRNPNLPCDPIRNYYKDLDRIEIIDDHNFKVIWKEKYFRALEFTLGLSPYPRHFYRPEKDITDEQFAENLLKEKAARNQTIVGCGAYIFEKYIKGDRIILRKNPEYYGIKPGIERLVIREIKNTEKQLLELKSGKLDAMGLTAVQWLEQTGKPDFIVVTDDIDRGHELSKAHDLLKKEAYQKGEEFGSHKFEKFLYRRFAYNFIAWNMRKKMFSDKRVRQALTHCINREKIINEVFLNLGNITTGPFVPHSLYYDSDIKPWPFDIERAKELLASSGWKDSDGDGVLDKDLDGDGVREPFEFTFLMIQNHPYQSQWVPIIRQDMLRAGIRMKVKQAEWAVYSEQVGQRNYDACSFYWGGGIESDPYQLWHSSQADKKDSSNVTGFKNDETDKIMEQARKTLDLEKRIALYKEFHRIIHEEQPYTFIYCPNAKLAQSKKFHNSITYVLGMSSSLQWVPKSMQE